VILIWTSIGNDDVNGGDGDAGGDHLRRDSFCFLGAETEFSRVVIVEG